MAAPEASEDAGLAEVVHDGICEAFACLYDLHVALFSISRSKSIPQGKLKRPRTTGAEKLSSCAKGLIELG